MAGRADKANGKGRNERLRDASPGTLDVLARAFAPEEQPELVYLPDEEVPGIRRVRRGKGFSYYWADGSLIEDASIRQRIKRLAVPPAWTDVWISPLPAGHLQATGRDKRGRKQYLYHERWREVRDANKFNRLVAFGHALPELRRRAAADARRRHLSKEKVVAVVVQLLDETLIRVGNEEYARDNDAYGLTTLRDDHAEISTTRLRLVFRGKGGKEAAVGIRSRRLARIVKRCQELPGEELFQYIDDQGNARAINSADVNDYLRENSSERFSAKDFRTWGGTKIMAERLAAGGGFQSTREADRKINEALDIVARHLNNTRAVARSSYVHPAVIDSFREGELTERWPLLIREGAKSEWLRPEELALLRLLEERTVLDESLDIGLSPGNGSGGGNGLGASRNGSAGNPNGGNGRESAS